MRGSLSVWFGPHLKGNVNIEQPNKKSFGTKIEMLSQMFLSQERFFVNELISETA